nr:MAG TPA: Putative tail protein [Caudoviricetes sp.]
MKNVSNEFKNIIKSGGPFYAYASITLKNGEKLYLDSDNDFFISGNGYAEDGGDGFPLGSALSKSVTLVIDNIDERFSKYDFYYAQISLFTEADIESRSYDAWRDVKGEEILDVNGNTIMLTKSRIERLNEGTFTVLEPTAVGDTIELVGYDSMYKADADFTSKLSYPTTAGQLLREACSTCNIMLGSPKFNNDDFVIEQAPEKVTCREVIGYIAMLSVGNAVIQNGTLVIKSYDFSAISKITNRDDLVEDAGYSILMDYQSDPDISTDPVVITGIATTKKVENESTILIRGTDDYALEITNPLIEGHEDDAINLIGDVLIGVKLRGFSGEFFPDPTIEFMDLACVVDRKDKVYPTFITSHEFSYLGSSSFSCGIKDPERQKSTYYSEAKKVYEKANKEIKQNKTDFEAAVENLNKTLENASGMYSTESPQPDGSMITYIHDKPTVEESKNVIKVTSEAIGISNDGGKTYPYGLFLTGDLITRILYAIGINADYINSGSLTVKDKNGNITFYADTETGRVTINAESISITGKSVEDISNGIVDDFVTNIYKNDIDEIKESVRNKIETWYQDSDPSVNWKDKSEHEGDLWKDTRDNKEYIYRSGKWEEMNVPDEVFDEIDSKAQIFINEPTTPYKLGDLWFESETKELLTCIKSRATGSCVKADWEKRTKYTDDSTVNTFITKIYESDIDDIRNQIDQKIETWYQSTDPSVNWGGTVEMAWCDVNGESILDVNGNEIILLYEESKAEHEGDLWKDLSTNDEYIYRGGQWMKMQVPDEVFDEIDGKAQIFINTPVPPYRVGDLWFDADTQELLTCVESRDKGSCVKSDWQKKTKYTDDSGLNTFISAVYDPKIAELQSQIDGQIETWFYDHEPSLQNEPAVNWTTNEQRKDHEGDLFFWKSTGYSYRFLQDGAVWKWQIVQDTDISKALAAAEKAQDTADHKRRVFVVTPQPPYDIGDLWVQGDDGDIMRCCVARSESASFSASDWEKASKYTDDTRANEVQKELETVNKDLQNQIDGKIETYNQSADPAASWTTAELKAKHTGDLWYNSKTEETMRWNGSAWSKLSDADAKAAKNLAVTKKRVFSVTPYPPYDTDDLWVQGTNGDLMRCVTSCQSGEYVASDWVKATKYTDDSAINNFVKNTYAADLENIKNQIDQKIETWFQPTDPSLNWTGKETQPLCDINGNDILDVSGKNITITVETEKATHEGDLWKNSKTGDEYIYRSGNWEKMPVPDSVFDEIDGKAQIFSTQPKPPYSVDDLYFTGNDILVCLKDRETGEYVASDWQKKDNYTDDSTVTDFIENIYDPKIEDIQNQIDGKIDTYYCDYEPANSNHPASEWTTAYERQKHVGDLFFWKNKGFTYRYMKVDTSYQWVRVKDADIVSAMETASKAQDTADGKRRNFITTPVPPYDVGDLWTQGNDGDLMRCRTARTSGNFVSSDWVKATKYTDDSAVDKLNKSLTSEEVFNRLTDNGKKQGIYMQGDQLYINFSYGKGGTLTLGGVNNENGSIQILDAIGAEVGKWDKDGLNIQKGSIYGSTIYLDKEKAYALIVGRNNSKEIFTIGSMGMHIDNTNMGLLASDSMVVDLMGGWFHGLRMKASNNGRGYGSSISPECFSIGWAEDLQGWSDAMSTVKSYTFSISENSTGCLSIRINGSSYINDYVDISPREIKTTGTKNRVVPTENYSNRLQYCYETASPMFGDIGEGITDENGECIVEIGDIFTETVTTRIEYQVFLQKEGKGDLWIEKKEENYFIVHGTPNLKFAWELKAKQKDYEYVNLEEDVDREEKLPESPENILNAELETLIKEQEELLNETA